MPTKITADSPPDQLVAINCGGTRFETTLGTLRKYPESMLAGMFSGRHELKMDDSGAVFINRNPVLFSMILEFLRLGVYNEPIDCSFACGSRPAIDMWFTPTIFSGSFQ